MSPTKTKIKQLKKSCQMFSLVLEKEKAIMLYFYLISLHQNYLIFKARVE